jgi:hypothetical protein
VRNAWRALVVFAAVPLSVLVTSPAWASAHPEDGDDPGRGLDIGTTLLIYLGIPALVIGTVWLLVSAPSMARGPRYRPALSWWAAPKWFKAPPWFGTLREEESLAAIVPGDETLKGGGASARW